MAHRSNDDDNANSERIGVSNEVSKHKTQQISVNHESSQTLQRRSRVLSYNEECTQKIINNCLKNWYSPWIKMYLRGGREFKIVYDLMDGLLHYEYQIVGSESALSNDRINAIAQAVARLVDYGNAILNIDLIIRANDETSSELVTDKVTTIELYQAHLKANSLREKLLYDYFRKDKRTSIVGINNEDSTSICSGVNTSLTQPSHPMISLHSPTLDRSHRSSIGSNVSINTISDNNGRRTPQPSPNQIELVKNPIDLNNHIEMTHMTATIRSNAFSASQHSATRLGLLPGILAKISSLLTVPASYEKISNCFELLDNLLHVTESLPVEHRTKEVNMIANSLLKPIVTKVFIDDRDSFVEFQHAHWTTCLLSIIRMMTTNDFNNYMRQFNNLTDLGAFLKDYLFIVKRFVISNENHILAPKVEPINLDNVKPRYPNCWIEMYLLASSVFLTSLTYLYQIMRQYFASNIQMWSSFIECLVYFMLQESLKPNRIMLKHRQSLVSSDLRKTSAEYVWISWDCLSHEQKNLLLEDLAEPLLRACMILDSRQRAILLPVFYDMMHCNYTSQYGSVSSIVSNDKNEPYMPYIQFSYQDHGVLNNQDRVIQSSSRFEDSLPYLHTKESSADGTVLTKFTHLIISKLYLLMNDKFLGDEQFKTEFCDAIAGDLNPKYYNQNLFPNSFDTSQFKSMARQTSNLIEEFMQICLDSRQANKSSYKHSYLLCIFKMILFFRDKVSIVEIYLQNLYKLCSLHHSSGRYAEAGFTLMEYAKSLPWSKETLSIQSRIISRFFNSPNQLTDFVSLKIFLYETIIEYFDQAQLWEAAIPLCDELIKYYQFRIYDYRRLSNLLQRMSIFFNKITDINQRNNPEYFRVTFYGNGFPDYIRNMTMVYRGKPYEKLGDFQSTILEKYPDAKLLASLAKPDESILKSNESRLLQINACSPVINLKSKFNPNLDTNVEESILNYYRYNECDKFQFCRRISKEINAEDKQDGKMKVNDDNFANMWRERTILTTNTLPGMLPFFPVYLIETSTISPIESAIEDLERTNDRLLSMLNRFKADKRQVEDIRLLGQLLLGIVDAAVNGGIAKYEEAFFNNNNYSFDSSNNPRVQLNVRTAQMNDNVQVSMSPSIDQNGITNTNSKGKLKELNGQVEQEEQEKQKQLQFNTQVDKLKCLIARQVPLLDEAIRLHGSRVADIMRPQHEHLEDSYHKLKHRIMTKYSRYLPADYARSSRSGYRSLARSPHRSIRSEMRLSSCSSGRSIDKRLSDVGFRNEPACDTSNANPINVSSSTNIPYRQLCNERRSLPFLTGIQVINREKETTERQQFQPDCNKDQLSKNNFYQKVNRTKTSEPKIYIEPPKNSSPDKLESSPYVPYACLNSSEGDQFKMPQYSSGLNKDEDVLCDSSSSSAASASASGSNSSSSSSLDKVQNSPENKEVKLVSI